MADLQLIIACRTLVGYSIGISNYNTPSRTSTLTYLFFSQFFPISVAYHLSNHLGQKFKSLLWGVLLPYSFTCHLLSNSINPTSKTHPWYTHFSPSITTVAVAQLLNCVQSLATPWTVAPQAPLSMGFPRQAYWSGLLFLPPGNRSDPGIEPRSPTLAGGFFTAEPSG